MMAEPFSSALEQPAFSTARMETVPTLIALTALIVSLIALVFSWKQLHEAQTSNGGRGMNFRISLANRSQMSPEEASQIDAAIAEYAHEYVVFLYSFRVTGPAAYFEVIPYTWGSDGVNDPVNGFDPIPRLDAMSGEVSFAALIQKELVESVKFGVAWLQPSGQGLIPGAVRMSLNQDLEEWCWRSRWISKLPFIRPGRWKRRKQPKASVGPLTQPWELKRRQKPRKGQTTSSARST